MVIGRMPRSRKPMGPLEKAILIGFLVVFVPLVVFVFYFTIGGG